MHAGKTAALLALATLLVAGTGVAAATDAPSAAQAENATINHDGEAVTLVTEPNATVTGETSLEAGTELTVRLRSSNTENPFLLSNETAVGQDGRFAASFNLTSAPDGAEATLTVRGDGERLAELPVRLVAEPTPTATASPTPAASPTSPGTSSGDGPGFGALAAVGAFIALGSALVLGRRA